MIKLLWDKTKEQPVLLQEKVYSNVKDQNVTKAIEQWALDKANAMGLKLVNTYKISGKLYEGRVVGLGNLMIPFE